MQQVPAVRVERIHPSELGAGALDVAVVIDVLRATSTATVLFGRGVDQLRVVATLRDLERLPEPQGGYLVVSELPQADRYGLRVDNSPVKVSTVDIAGRTPVLVTTNGTRTLSAAASRAERVLLACLLNVSAVGRHLRRAAPRRVTLLPSGDFDTGERHMEDECCADALEAMLGDVQPDLSALCRRSLTDARVQRRIVEENLADDVALCLTADLYEVTLEFTADGENAGWIRPCAPAR